MPPESSPAGGTSISNVSHSTTRQTPDPCCDQTDAKTTNDVHIGDTASSVTDSYYFVTQVSRAVALAVIVLSIYSRNCIQAHVDTLWAWLRHDSVFRSAYFETIYVTAVYGLIIAAYPYAAHYMPFLQRFKVTGDVTYIHQTTPGIVLEAVKYVAPLLAADAVIVKRYWDVHESEWETRRHQWIQTTRALPGDAPPFLLLCAQVAASVFVFDFLFFGVHLLLHKNLFLFKHFHAVHHQHTLMHAHVTNQLSVVERLLLIASANYALKLFRCHPLTRVVYVPVFLWLLVDNHTGYDLPWGPHRLVPWGLMGGPAKHYAHHVHGTRHYQPFFNYLDSWLEGRRPTNAHNQVEGRQSLHLQKRD
ncbi:unnamed protein product [Lymnaea stagnalis]|uniref:Fatty acid hydroxylase domain-containing protein n=1 Tax=Lymnaea stagnalis TaxID=6523 RepID=A0AAV2HBC9_LYMST